MPIAMNTSINTTPFICRVHADGEEYKHHNNSKESTKQIQQTNDLDVVGDSDEEEYLVGE